MKRLSTIIISILLVLLTAPSVWATNDTIEVSSLDELQAAIKAADDGDAILVTQTIEMTPGETIGDPQKHITIIGDSELLLAPSDFSQIAPGEKSQFQPNNFSQRSGMKLVNQIDGYSSLTRADACPA